ncbi:hypothetical protein LC612_30695 [Nostoc sp. CHAB 5834]|nr:hypothetical protein [Nostoc sp. CHAB 5834]
MNPAQPYAGAHLRTGGTRTFSNHPQNAKKMNGPRPSGQAPAPNLNLASALRVRNFRLLAQAIGDEDLAVALDLNMGRVKEIADGINYTDETAYHIETVLGLASGFMDKVNPKLDATDIERIKTLRHQGHAEEVVETAPAPVKNHASPVVQVVNPPVASPSLAVATTPVSTEIEKMSDNNNQNPSTDSANFEEIALREVRQQNLAVLTDRPKAKSHLARLTQMSPANISHRLHGNKIFDKATADYFCKVLGLPLDWFETPKSEAQIPPEIIHRLVSADSRPAEEVSPVLSRAPRLSQPAKKKLAPAPLAPVGQPSVSLSAASIGVAPAPAANAPAASSPAMPALTEPVKAQRGPKKVAAAPAPTVVLSSVRAPAAPVATPPVASIPVLQSVAQQEAPVASAPVNPATPSVANNPASAPAQPPVVAPIPNAAAVATKAPSLAEQILYSVPSPVGPIAEALLRTLAQKSREGLLTETQALRILTDVVSL